MKSNKPNSSRKPTGKAPKSATAAPKTKTPAATTKSTPSAPVKAAAPAKPAPAAPVRKTAPKPAEAVKQQPKKAPVKATLKVPSILLEGDQPAAPPVGGPGQRYSLGPTPPSEHVGTAEGQLPESYGTKQLFLAARDPHWLYAAWDLSAEEQKKYNALSSDRHLVLRVYRDNFAAQPLSQVHVHPESRNWFIPVTDAATRYVAELGYYNKRTQWTEIAKSGATFTPPDSLAEDTSVRFATIAADVPFAELIAMVKAAVRENVPLVEALEQLRAEGVKGLPHASEVASGEWTPAQEQALAQVITMDQVRRIWIGSLEVTELIRRQLERQISSMVSSQFAIPTSPLGGISSLSSVSSPFGGVEQRGKGFWFNVNAELIIYGATEPDAKVTIGDRPIKLRPDGSFSFRFCLPDGAYSLPVVATSADGDDSRLAALKFGRESEYRGDVGKHPQDASLKPPLVTSVA